MNTLPKLTHTTVYCYHPIKNLSFSDCSRYSGNVVSSRFFYLKFSLYTLVKAAPHKLANLR